MWKLDNLLLRDTNVRSKHYKEKRMGDKHEIRAVFTSGCRGKDVGFGSINMGFPL